MHSLSIAAAGILALWPGTHPGSIFGHAIEESSR